MNTTTLCLLAIFVVVQTNSSNAFSRTPNIIRFRTNLLNSKLGSSGEKNDSKEHVVLEKKRKARKQEDEQRSVRESFQGSSANYLSQLHEKNVRKEDEKRSVRESFQSSSVNYLSQLRVRPSSTSKSDKSFNGLSPYQSQLMILQAKLEEQKLENSLISKDVVIIGGGLAGLSVALHIVQTSDRKVTILEKECAMEQMQRKTSAASFTASGILLPQNKESSSSSALLELCAKSRSMYPQFVRSIERITKDCSPNAAGFLYGDRNNNRNWKVGYSAKGGSLLPIFSDYSKESWIPSNDETQKIAKWLDDVQIREVEPFLHPDAIGGWWFPEDASVDVRRLACALRATCVEKGVEFYFGDGYGASSLELSEGTCKEIRLEDGRYFTTNSVVVANGPWMRRLLPVPITPTKSQYISLRMPSDKPPILNRVIFDEDTYIVPKSDGRIIIETTVGRADDFECKVTLSGLLQCIDKLKLIPMLNDLTIEDEWAGLQSTTPDKEPILGRTIWNNVYIAGGYGQNGALLSPKTGQLIGDLVVKNGKNLDIEDENLIRAFSWDRFIHSRQTNFVAIPNTVTIKDDEAIKDTIEKDVLQNEMNSSTDVSSSPDSIHEPSCLRSDQPHCNFSQVDMPALSSTMKEGKVVSWLKEEGDSISAGEAIMVVESDKADMDVEAYEDGFLAAVIIEEGGSSAVGSPVALIAAEESDIDVVKTYAASLDGAAPALATTATSGPVTPVVTVPKTPVSCPAAACSTRIVASPFAKKRAKELVLDIGTVLGTGPGGRVIAIDVENAAVFHDSKSAPAKPSWTPAVGVIAATPMARAAAKKAKLNLATIVGTGQFGRVTVDDVKMATGELKPKRKPSKAIELPEGLVPFTGMQRAVSANMEATLTTPVFRVSRAVEMDNFDALYQRVKPKGVSVSVLLAKACALALEKYPIINSSYNPEGTVFNPDINIAMAVAIDGGLITPTLKYANERSIIELGENWKELVQKAKEGRLSPDEYNSGTFTISNLGMFGVTQFDAILPPGMGSILAIGCTQDVIVPCHQAILGMKKVKKMVVTLTCDHRQIYGSDAALFLKEFASVMSSPEVLVL